MVQSLFVLPLHAEPKTIAHEIRHDYDILEKALAYILASGNRQNKEVSKNRS